MYLLTPSPHAMSPWVTFRWTPSPLHVGDVICEQPNTESYGRNIAETLYVLILEIGHGRPFEWILP